MKKILLFILAMLLFNTSWAQDAPPEMFKFQALITKPDGKPVKEKTVGVKIAIRQSATNGTLVYRETFTPTTNNAGIINIEIGNGTPKYGVFSEIPWAAGEFFLKLRVDIHGGTNYTNMGASQLLSVPYALFAKKAMSVEGDDDTDPTNEIELPVEDGTDGQILTTDGEGTVSWQTPEEGSNELPETANENDVLTFDGSEWVALENTDTDPTNEIELPEDAIENDLLTWNGVSWVALENTDGDPTNELELPELDGTAGQVLTTDGEGMVSWQIPEEDSNELPETANENDVLTFSESAWVALPEAGNFGFYYADKDEDSYGDKWNIIYTNVAPEGFVNNVDDCDDNDATVYPGAVEVCDGKDNNCDGVIDEGVTTTYYADADGDGYGDSGTTKKACSEPIGYVSDNSDCDDTDATVYPGAAEVCDGKDNDCNEVIDEGCDTDSDDDGFTIGQGDCDDGDNTVYPGAEELCDNIDNNCDDEIDEGCDTDADNFIFYYADRDGDGYGDKWNVVYADIAPEGFVSNADDCNDLDESINPNAAEIPEDGVDQNCDGIDPYFDQDGDGFTSDVDCDDSDNTVYPGAPEICWDSVDNNCNGQLDEDCILDCRTELISALNCVFQNCNDLTDFSCIQNSCPEALTLYSSCLDLDCVGSLQDSIDPNWTAEQLADYLLENCGKVDADEDGYTGQDGDCDDNDNTIYPGATEICDDGIDQDCNGSDALCGDNDVDGFVSLAEGGDDCNDGDNTVYPGADEFCNGVDNNCDGLIDNVDVSDGDQNAYYIDEDGDGYGSDSNVLYSCEPIEGYVQESGDCDDNDPSVFPEADEVCDGKDNDCNEEIDEGLTTTYYADADGDGYGDYETTKEACSEPIGYVSDYLDCNDTDETVFPGATEVCDGIDNNCDNNIDEDCSIDDDGDGLPDSVDPDSQDSDSDNDGLMDGEEDLNENGLQDGIETDPLDADSDDDGISDGNEKSWYLSPLDSDTDGDGLPDGLEIGRYVGLLDGISDGTGVPFQGTAGTFIPDADDGATITDPGDADSDNDGLDDGTEDANQNGQVDSNETSPWDSDTDDDGIADGFEVVTDALVADTDDDGLIDGLELGIILPVSSGYSEGSVANHVFYNGTDGFTPDSDPSTQTNPIIADTDSDSVNDGTEDANQNGQVDLGECDPNDPANYPGATEVCDGIDNNCDGGIDEGCETDVSVAMTDSPDPVNAHTNLEYLVEVTNNGPITASGTMVNLTLDPSLTFVAASAGVTYNVSQNTVTWDVGTLVVGAVQELTISTNVSDYLGNGTVLTSGVIVTINEFEINEVNNQTYEYTTVQVDNHQDAD